MQCKKEWFLKAQILWSENYDNSDCIQDLVYYVVAL